MNNKIYDYVKFDFWKRKDDQGNIHYFLRVKSEYVEVSKDVYKVCESSYGKLRYDVRRKAEKSVISFNDEDSAAFFVYQNNRYDPIEKIYINDMAILAVNEIYKLRPEYREIAICIFLKEMTVAETSDYLHIPYSTVRDRKLKIQKILQEIIKESVK